MTTEFEALLATPAPQPIAFELSLAEAGWASLRVLCGEQVFHIDSFGYCTDGLGDLVRAALCIATGANYTEVLFDCEPQTWGLALEPAGLSTDNKRIARLTVRDGGKALGDPGHSGFPVWKWSSAVMLEGYVCTDDFAQAVEKITVKARADYDDAVYRERWGYPGSLEGFPLRGLRALQTALSIQEYRE